MLRQWNYSVNIEKQQEKRMNTDNSNLNKVFRKNPELNLKIIKHLIENEGRCYITR